MLLLGGYLTHSSQKAPNITLTSTLLATIPHLEVLCNHDPTNFIKTCMY